MNHFRPHLKPQPKFEGYFSKFSLSSGGHVVLILCSVPKAGKRPHMVSFTYVPPSFPETPHFQRQIWADDIQMLDHLSSLENTVSTSETEQPIAFQVTVPEIGSMTVYTDDSTTYDIADPDGTFSFTAHVTGNPSKRTPWLKSNPSSTPEGLLINLPLPLHWHVHTLASSCTLTISIPPRIYPHLSLPVSDAHHAIVHQEKNWATSFPMSHTWIKAHNPDTGTTLCVAGGSILASQAYLLTYHARDPKHSIHFTPPLAMAPTFCPSLSPSLRASVSWPNRSVHLTIASLTSKIEVEAVAAPDSFVSMAAPFANGHRLDALGQSFCATVSVKVSWADRGGFGAWNVVCKEFFEAAGLEFGADSYGGGAA